MDKFVVSARKYRPQTFDTVIGQAHITTTLKNAIRNNQLAHAFLFCGPRGVGKTTCARILAKTINCENRTKDGEACNECVSCKSFNQGTSLNIHELDAASNNSVDDIRVLVEQIRFAPQAGRYKVYIIDEVHMLSSAAFNAFLKTLEEPPPFAIFILATTEKHKILPTILSRCQIFDFKRISVSDTTEHLEEICEKENIQAEKAALQLIAQKSEGCMRDALSILDKITSFTSGHVSYQNTLEHLNILDEEYYFKLMDCIIRQDAAEALLVYDEINQKGFEGDTVMNGFAEFIRNLLVCSDKKVISLLEVVESFREKYIEVSAKVSPALLVSALNLLSEAEINYKAARNKKLHVELLLIKLCYLNQAVTLASGDMLQGAGISKKKITDRPLSFRTQVIRPYPGAQKKKISTAKRKKPLSVQQEENHDYDAAVTAEITGKPGNPVVTGEKKSLRNDTAGKDQTNTRLAGLEKIRKQVRGNQNGNGQPVLAQPLETATLHEAWKAYVQKLKTEKNPAAPNFENAELRIQDENSFIALVSNTIQFKFIEQNGQKVSQYLRKKLQNPQLQFFIVMEENKEMKMPADTPLTAREQFQKMTELYPLVKEIKDRLKLELDY